LTCDILDIIIRTIKPSDLLILAVDGVCPLPKVQQQKRRRYLSAMERDPSSIHDTNEITPGTDLMKLLDEYIVRSTPTWSNNPENPIAKVIYSPHTSPGEGEHKIFGYYRQGVLSNLTNLNHVIYGMDSDFILISLLSNVERLYLARDSVRMVLKDHAGKPYTKARREPQQQQQSQPSSKPAGGGLGGKKVLDVGELRRGIRALYPNNPHGIAEFVFTFGLLGNDFLPSTPSIRTNSATTSVLLQASIAASPFISLVDGEYAVDPTKLKVLFASLAARENERISGWMDELRAQGKTSSVMNASLHEGVFNMELYRNAWYTNALAPRDIQLMEMLGLTFEPQASEVSGMVEQLLRGLQWTLDYYTLDQSKVTWLWYYPYVHAPLLSDIVKVLAAVDGITYTSEGGETGKVFDSIMNTSPVKDEMRFKIIHQLVAVIPIGSKTIIPQQLLKLYGKGSPLRDLMPESFEIEREGFELEHQAVPLIPPADYKRIMLAVEGLEIPRQVRNELERVENDKISTLTPQQIQGLRMNVLAQQSPTGFPPSIRVVERSQVPRGNISQTPQRTPPQTLPVSFVQGLGPGPVVQMAPQNVARPPQKRP